MPCSDPSKAGASCNVTAYAQIIRGGDHVIGRKKVGGQLDIAGSAGTERFYAWTEVQAGGTFWCGKKTSGPSLFCYGLVIDGNVNPPGNAVGRFALGTSLGCAIDATSQALVCWGHAITPPAGAFTDVACGGNGCCALDATGGATCFGSAPAAPATKMSAIAVGETHACGIAKAGYVLCWGNAADGRTTAPVGSYTAISAGDAFTCAIDTAKEIHCWGAGPTSSIPSGPFVSVSAWGDPGTGGAACGLRPDGAALCWDYNAAHPFTP